VSCNLETSKNLQVKAVRRSKVDLFGNNFAKRGSANIIWGAVAGMGVRVDSRTAIMSSKVALT